VAIAYGVLPTLASAILGWIQGGVDKLTDSDLRYTPIERAIRAMNKGLDGWAGRIAVRIEGVAMTSVGNATNTRDNSGIIDAETSEVATPKKWNDLNQRDIDWILTKRKNARGAIMARFQVSNGTAGNWLKDLTNGSRPWQNDKKLPENVP